MHLAVGNRNLKLINFLANRGANLMLKNGRNQYPIDIASENNDIEIMQFLVRLGNLLRFQKEVSKKPNINENLIDQEISNPTKIPKSIKSFSIISKKKRSILNIDSISFEAGNKNSKDINQSIDLKQPNIIQTKEESSNQIFSEITQKEIRKKKKRKKRSGSLDLLN